MINNRYSILLVVFAILTPGVVVAQTTEREVGVRRKVFVRVISSPNYGFGSRAKVDRSDFKTLSNGLGDLLDESSAQSITVTKRPSLVPQGQEYWILSVDDERAASNLRDVITRLPGVIYSGVLSSEAGDLRTVDPSDEYWDYTLGGVFATWGFDQSEAQSFSDIDTNAPEMWEMTSDDPVDSDILIAIVDTGINTSHEDWGTFSTKVPQYFNSWDAIYGLNPYSTDIEDRYHFQGQDGHGTLIAGLIGAVTDNGIGGVGALGGDYSESNLGVSLFVVKADSQQSAQDEDHWPDDLTLGTGISEVVWNSDAVAINFSNSRQYPANMYVVSGTLGMAYQANIPVIVSMGNENNSVPRYPAAWNDLSIAVGAITPSGSRGYDSSYGDHIDVVAPGTTIAPGIGSSDDYETGGGTSTAVPFVTAEAGLIRHLDPDASVNRVKAFIRASATLYPDFSQYYGFGLVKYDEAVRIATDGDGMWERERSTSPAAWGYDDETIQDYMFSGGPFPEGIYNFKRYRVTMPFTTNYSEDAPAVWVEPENTNGFQGHSIFVAQPGSKRFAEPVASTFSKSQKEGLTRITGTIETYVYEVFDEEDEFVDWYPVAPAQVTVEYTMRGILHPEEPAPSAEYLGGAKNDVEVTWARNDDVESVTEYEVRRSLDGGAFQVIATPEDPGSGAMTYTDRIGETEAETAQYSVRAYGTNGWSTTGYTQTVEIEGGPQRAAGVLDSAPEIVTLRANYPNPFNPNTEIKFGIPKTSAVRLRVLNTRGQTVRTLVNGEKSPGWYTISWNGKNDIGREVASGIYLYVLEVEGERLIRRMTLIR